MVDKYNNNEKEKGISVGKEIPDVAPGSSNLVRPDMVEAARQFMMMDKVRETGFEQQRQFLLRKGLRDDEIEQARKTIQPSVKPFKYGDMASTNSSSNSAPSSIGFGQFAKYALLFSGFSYAGWQFLRCVILPRLFSIPEPIDDRMHAMETKITEMQSMMQNVMMSVGKTMKAINDQQVLLNQILHENDRATQLEKIQKDIQGINTLLATRQKILEGERHGNLLPICAEKFSSPVGKNAVFGCSESLNGDVQMHMEKRNSNCDRSKISEEGESE